MMLSYPLKHSTINNMFTLGA